MPESRSNNLDDLLNDVTDAPAPSSGLAGDDLTEGSPLMDARDPNFPDSGLPNDLPSETMRPDLLEETPAEPAPAPSTEPALESLEADADLV